MVSSTAMKTRPAYYLSSPRIRLNRCASAYLERRQVSRRREGCPATGRRKTDHWKSEVNKAVTRGAGDANPHLLRLVLTRKLGATAAGFRHSDGRYAGSPIARRRPERYSSHCSGLRSKDARGFVVGDDAEYAFACAMISLWEGVGALRPGAQQNGKVERTQRADLEEFGATVDPKSVDLRHRLDEWQHFWNWHRPHTTQPGL